jgi:hypothetical protein
MTGALEHLCTTDFQFILSASSSRELSTRQILSQTSPVKWAVRSLGEINHTPCPDTQFSHHEWSADPHNNFNPPVIRSTTLFGAGPTPNTVRLPASICVRPASAITSAVTPKLLAMPISSVMSSWLLICTAILACPFRSQRFRILASADFGFFCEALRRVL